MPLNTNIAMGYRGPEIQPQNMLADYAAVQQIQGGRQTQELNQLKMQEYERARTEEEGLRNYLAKADLATPDARAGLVRFGKTGLAYGKALTEQDTAALTQREAAFKVQKAKGDFIAQAKRDTSQNPSDANLTAFKEDLLANPLFTAPEKTQLAANVDRILAMPVDQRRTFMASQGASASELKPVLTPQNLGGTVRLLSTPAFGGAATPVEGSVGTVTMTPAQEREAKDSAIRIKQEGQRIGLEGRRVAVLEQDAKQKQDPVFQQAMAGARATGEAIAKGTVAAQQALPGVITNAMIAVNAVDDMVGRQEVKDASGKVIQPATAPHKGFQDAVGATWKPGFRFIPGTDASDFQSYQDQIEGAAFLSAFEALKGGGAISEKEGSKATAAKLRMKLAQSEVEYVKAAREFQEVVRTGVENARRKFGAGGAAPAAGGANIDALLDKYK